MPNLVKNILLLNQSNQYTYSIIYVLKEKYGKVSYVLKSGLYDKATAIFYGCSCPDCDVILKNIFKTLPKFKELDKAIVPNKNTHENLTINAMIEKGKSIDAYFLYIHSKGTTNKTSKQHLWRHIMSYWMIYNHDICLDILSRGFYTVGTILQIFIFRHYTGNFFWTRSEFIGKYKPIQKLENRYNAENIILSKRVKNKNVNLSDNLMYNYYLYDFYTIKRKMKAYNLNNLDIIVF
jgi:hypothetical protein